MWWWWWLSLEAFAQVGDAAEARFVGEHEGLAAGRGQDVHHPVVVGGRYAAHTGMRCA